MLLSFCLSGCAFGGSASVNVGPKFLDDDSTAWTITVAFTPVTYLEPTGLPSDRMGGKSESAYAPGLAARAFTTTGYDTADGFVVAPGAGIGFVPYMLVKPNGMPSFDSHMGFQFAHAFGGSDGWEVGPYLSMAFHGLDIGNYAGMFGGGLECLIADGGLGCGPVAQFKLMRTQTFAP